jgi:hypothetical protein
MPFDHLAREFMVVTAVLQGAQPKLSDYTFKDITGDRDDPALREELWYLMQSCWKQASERPKINEVMNKVSVSEDWPYC